MDELAVLRDLSPKELAEMAHEIKTSAWSWVLRFGGDAETLASFHLEDSELEDDGVPAIGHLARAAALDVVLDQTRRALESDIRTAMKRGAEYADVGTALGISRQAAEQRFAHIRRAMKVAVVVSRRDRVRTFEGDARPFVGEVGGPGQILSDLGAWAVGAAVRAKAKHTIIAVDGAVRRVYEIAPGSWKQMPSGKWEFVAVNNRAMTQQEIETAYAAGELPLRLGYSCPTKAGGAYRPLWF